MTYFMRLSMLAAYGALGLFGAASAQQPTAQQNCAMRDHVIEQLAVKYGEVRQSIGLAPNNGVFEVYASQETRSWTILVTGTNGMACIVASGQAFETLGRDTTPAGDDV
jgi:hypothetical protein